MSKYKALLSQSTLDKAMNYLKSLQSGAQAGGQLEALLQLQTLDALSVFGLIELLMQTKQPQIFAESTVSGDGTDWNLDELSILGDISVAVPVVAYDNGRHQNPALHENPLAATLLFTPGALLRNGRGFTPADWDAVVTDSVIDPNRFYALYERRLLPPLLYASEMASKANRIALVTIPGLGCGQFAGVFSGQLGAHLQAALLRLIETHQERLRGIRAVYFDPYNECSNARTEIGAISFMVRPLTKGNEDKPQLCHPAHYAENTDEFVDCDLFSVVAWDHVSWPGNDFYIGARSTDDGVKAAATNSMEAFTGVTGTYDKAICEYLPPKEYRNWAEVVEQKNIQLKVKHNIQVFAAG